MPTDTATDDNQTAPLIRDPNTGLFSAYYFKESLEHELMRARRRSHSLSLLLLEIDHFKQFNKSFGRDAGDYILRAIGTLLGNSIRGEDIVCYMKDAKLSIILAETGAEQAAIVAAKLCNIIRSMQFEWHDTQLDKVTVSIGIASYPMQGHNGKNLFTAADAALDEAKHSGGDRFCFSSAQSEPLISSTKSLVEAIMGGANPKKAP